MMHIDDIEVLSVLFDFDRKVIINGQKLDIDVREYITIEEKYDNYLKTINFYDGRMFVEQLIQVSMKKATQTREDIRNMAGMNLIKIEKFGQFDYVVLAKKGLRYVRQKNIVTVKETNERMKDNPLRASAFKADFCLNVYNTCDDIETTVTLFKSTKNIELLYRGLLRFAKKDINEKNLTDREHGLLTQLKKPVKFTTNAAGLEIEPFEGAMVDYIRDQASKAKKRRFDHEMFGQDELSSLSHSYIYPAIKNVNKNVNLDKPYRLIFYIFDMRRSKRWLAKTLKRIDTIILRISDEKFTVRTYNVCDFDVCFLAGSEERKKIIENMLRDIKIQSEKAIERLPDLGNSDARKFRYDFDKALFFFKDYRVVNSKTDRFFERESKRANSYKPIPSKIEVKKIAPKPSQETLF